MILRCVVCVVLALVAPFANAQEAAADKLALAPKWVKDQRFEYRFNHRAVVVMSGTEGHGAERTMTITHEGIIRFNVVEADDEGAADLTCAITRLNAKWELVPGDFAAALKGPAQFQFIRANEEPEPAPVDEAEGEPAAEPGPDEPAAGALDGPLGAICRAVIVFDVRPDGTIRSIDGTEQSDAAARLHGEAGALALGPFAGGSITRFIERVWRLDDMAGIESETKWALRGPGETWTRKEERPMPYGGAADIQRTYSLAAQDGAGLWPIAITGKGTLNPPKGDPDPTVPVLTLDRWTEEGQAQWDAALGRVARRADKLSAQTTAAMADFRSVTSVQTTLELELVKP